MASIAREKNGTVRIWFIDAKGNRKGIRIGRVADDYASRFKSRVEDLVAASHMNSSPREELVCWVTGLSNVLQDRLASVGLIEVEQAEPEPDAPKLGEFVDKWMVGRSDVEHTSKQVYGRCRNWLVKFFGEDRTIDTITEGDADEWAAFLRSNLGENTARKMASIAKQIFKHATRKRLLESNAFVDLSAAFRASDERSQFVTRDEIDKAIEAAPDAEWKLIIALARYGGLRIPSELFPLKWQDINFDTGRMTVTSPKTKRHANGGSRVCPIFPELVPYFENALFEASDGKGRVAGSCQVIEKRLKSGNLATQFTRILKKAGVTPWPKLMINLRSSRQTELENSFPTHVVCKWLGNSPQIAHRHYLKVTDSHFEQALNLGAQSGANRAETVQDKAGQHATESDTETPARGGKHGESSVPPTKNGVPEQCPEPPSSGHSMTRRSVIIAHRSSSTACCFSTN